ncbi:glycosyltransferase [Reyranella sp.]|uniref:glycosyltransferase n=1 Tax=Reyranella sp. TaxID=1929291 RepID=UPI003D11C37A
MTDALLSSGQSVPTAGVPDGPVPAEPSDIVKNGNFAEWPAGREFKPRTRRSRLARDWYLTTQTEASGAGARCVEIETQDRVHLPALEVSGAQGWTRVEAALDVDRLAATPVNLLSFTAAARWPVENRIVGVKGLVRSIQILRRVAREIKVVTTVASDVVIDQKPRRHTIALSRECRASIQASANSAENSEGQSLFLAFTFDATSTPYLLTDVKLENQRKTLSAQDDLRTVVRRLMAERIALRMATVRFARGAAEAKSFHGLESIARSKAKLLRADLLKGDGERLVQRHFEPDEEGLDFIIEDISLLRDPNSQPGFEFALDTIADTVALRHIVQETFQKLAAAGPQWRQMIADSLKSTKPDVRDQLHKFSRAEITSMGIYEPACGRDLDLYVRVLKQLAPPAKPSSPSTTSSKAVSSKGASSNTVARPEQSKDPAAAKGTKRSVPGAQRPSFVRSSRYGASLQTAACFNDYFSVLRGQILGLERQALRERSWRTRELLAQVASEGALDFEGLLGVCQRLCRTQAGSNLRAAMGIAAPNYRALLSLARAVANQGLAEEDPRHALDIYSAVRATDGAELREIDWIQLILLHLKAGDVAAAQSALESSGLQQSHPIEFALLASNVIRAGDLTVPPREHLYALNLLYRKNGLEDVRVTKAATAFGGLATGPLDRFIADGPLVTVLMTTFNPEKDLDVAVQAVLDQSWRNLELIIVDDCSTPESFAHVKRWELQDPRVKVLRNDKNMGTYASKNRGLDVASGEFVTCHDSDDWSHPRKIECQVEALGDEDIACYSNWVRSSAMLEFQMFSAAGYLNYENPSSLLYRRRSILEKIGYYDSVRTGADSEFKHRMELAFGKQSLVAIELPLAFGLMHDQALTANSLGRGWFSHERKVYRSAWRAWHDKISGGEASPYVQLDPSSRVFSIPLSLSPDRPSLVEATPAPAPRHYNVVMISDFRMAGGNTVSTIEEMKCQVAAGITTAICQVGAFRKGFLHKEFIDPKVQELISAGAVDWIDLADQVEADILTIRYPGVFQFAERLKSGIRAKSVRVVLNQPPTEKDSRDRRYDVRTVSENIDALFGVPHFWAPIGPSVREAVEPFIRSQDMTETDWFNIIDLDEWGAPRTAFVSDRPVIGRHSRDDYTKWPDRLEDLFGAYPARAEFDVRILGGIGSIAGLVGATPPENWTVYPFNSVPPQQFLQGVDFFVFFHHPLRVEAFGRTVIEAMASGCVVILPRSFEPLFGDSVTYCEPQDVGSVVSSIYDAPDLFQQLSRRGFEFVRDHFSYGAHVARLKQLGLTVLSDSSSVWGSKHGKDDQG